MLLRVLLLCSALVELSACSRFAPEMVSETPSIASAAWAEPARAIAKAQYGVAEVASHYVPMRDGTRIALDVYLPRGLALATRVPTILHQTRYWRSLSFRFPAGLFVDSLEAQGRLGDVKRAFIERGYAWVDADVRGTGASTGTRAWDFTPAEIQDGAELADWIARQPWSNGILGAFGASYAGVAAHFLLVTRHPSVRAAAVSCAPFDHYTDILAPGGLLHRGFIEKWSWAVRELDHNRLPLDSWLAKFFVLGVRPVNNDRGLLHLALREHAHNADLRSLRGVVFRDDAPSIPVLDGTTAVSPEAQSAQIFLEQHLGPNFRTLGLDLGSSHSYAKFVAEGGVPLYIASGWFDGAYAHAAIKRFLTLSNPGSELVIGPWDHTLHHVRPGERGDSVAFDPSADLLRFFDRHLRGRATGAAPVAPVRYFTLGEERWKAAESWPPTAAPLALYLAPAAELQHASPPPAEAFDRYRVDWSASSGEQTRWESLLGRPLREPYFDRARADERLLVYTSPPLALDLEVTGHPIATLYVSSTAEDGAFFVYLEEVDSEGKVYYVSEGMLRAVHRRLLSESEQPYRTPVPQHSFKRAAAEALIPGEVAELVIDFLPTSYRFRRGSAIRLAVAGADRSRFLPVPSGDPPTLELHRDRSHPSRVELPVLSIHEAP